MAKKKVNYREIFMDEDLALDNEAKSGIRSQIKIIKIDDEKLRTAHSKLCAVLGLRVGKNEMAEYTKFRQFVLDEKKLWEAKEAEKKALSAPAAEPLAKTVIKPWQGDGVKHAPADFDAV